MATVQRTCADGSSAPDGAGRASFGNRGWGLAFTRIGCESDAGSHAADHPRLVKLSAFACGGPAL